MLVDMKLNRLSRCHVTVEEFREAVEFVKAHQGG